MYIFSIKDNNSIDSNLELSRIYISCKLLEINSCYIYDENGSIQILRFLDGKNYLTIDNKNQIKNVTLIPLSLKSAYKFLADFRNMTIEFCLFVLFNPIGNEFHNPINCIFRKIFGTKFPYIIRSVNKIGFFSFIFYLRRHGFLSYIKLGLKYFRLKRLRFIVLTSMTISIPLNFLNLKTYGYDYLIEYDLRAGVDLINGSAIILGDSPSHFDWQPRDFHFNKSKELASKLAFFLKSTGCEYDILPHPRDPYFSEKLASITGFRVVKTSDASHYKSYLAFPSSVIFSLPKTSKITLLSFPEDAVFASAIAKNYNYDLIIIK